MPHTETNKLISSMLKLKERSPNIIVWVTFLIDGNCDLMKLSQLSRICDRISKKNVRYSQSPSDMSVSQSNNFSTTHSKSHVDLRLKEFIVCCNLYFHTLTRKR